MKYTPAATASTVATGDTNDIHLPKPPILQKPTTHVPITATTRAPVMNQVSKTGSHPPPIFGKPNLSPPTLQNTSPPTPQYPSPPTPQYPSPPTAQIPIPTSSPTKKVPLFGQRPGVVSMPLGKPITTVHPPTIIGPSHEISATVTKLLAPAKPQLRKATTTILPQVIPNNNVPLRTASTPQPLALPYVHSPFFSFVKI